MRTRALLPAAAAACLLLSACERVATAPLLTPAPPSRITNGEVDGAAHPAVILIVMDIGGSPAFRCSGTLIAPKLVLTAG